MHLNKCFTVYTKEKNNMYVIAVFKSRRDALQFADALTRFGVSVTVVNTPRRIGVPCGLSVRFHRREMSLAEKVLSRNDYFGFKGFYSVQ